MTACTSTAADPEKVGALVTCEHATAPHLGTMHHAQTRSGTVVTWGDPTSRRLPPMPANFDALTEAYAAAQRDPSPENLEWVTREEAEYNAQLIAEGFAPNRTPIDLGGAS